MCYLVIQGVSHMQSKACAISERDHSYNSVIIMKLLFVFLAKHRTHRNTQNTHFKHLCPVINLSVLLATCGSFYLLFLILCVNTGMHVCSCMGNMCASACIHVCRSVEGRGKPWVSCSRCEPPCFLRKGLSSRLGAHQLA